MAAGRIILSEQKLNLVLDRLAHQLIEYHGDFADSCIVGIQPRGKAMSDRIVARLQKIAKLRHLQYGLLDVTFHRDDFRRRQGPLLPSDTRIDFSIEGKAVILIDDVLFTGRTLRSGLDALLDFGRPARVELMVLLHRLYSQEFPIRPDYFGRKVNTLPNQRIHVEWMEESERDFVWIETFAPSATPPAG